MKQLPTLASLNVILPFKIRCIAMMLIAKMELLNLLLVLTAVLTPGSAQGL